MKQRISPHCWMLGMCICLLGQAFAMPIAVPTQFNWVFSGMVANEQGQRYGYYFEVRRQGKQFHVLSTLVNVDKKTLIFVDENEATLPQDSAMNWQIGRAYVGFNEVTNRWVLGIKTLHQQGFHFKINPETTKLAKVAQPLLKNGLALSVTQMGRLNGHVRATTDDEFVVAKHTWFRQVMTPAVASPTAANAAHPLMNVLCQFNDGSGFYATHLLARDALRSFVAGWRSPSGEVVNMSQFVTIHHPSKVGWDLSSSLPAFHIRFSDVMGQTMAMNTVSAGVVDGKMAGFCTAARAQV